MARHKQLKSKKDNLNRDERRMRKKRRQMSIILVILMVASVFAMVFSGGGSNPELNYGEYKFKPVYNEDYGRYFYATEVDKIDHTFLVLPQDAQSIIPIEGNLSATLNDAFVIFFSADASPYVAPYVDQVRYEAAQVSKIPLKSASLVEGTSLEQITCANATVQTPVIEYYEAADNQTTQVVIEDGCIRATIRDQDLLIFRDRLLYSLLGIING